MSVKPIPDGYHSVTPYLYIKGASEAIAWYQKAFGATEMMRLNMPESDIIMHAEIKIGNSIVMLTEENPDWGAISPSTLGGIATSFMIYVEDVDSAYKQAIDAGATVVRDIADQFYGDRSGCLSDPYGHQWTIATHVEDLSEEEMMARFNAQMQR